MPVEEYFLSYQISYINIITEITGDTRAGSIQKELELIISIPILELEQELELKVFVILRRTFLWCCEGYFTQLGVLLCRQWCLLIKKSWTKKLLVKRYPAINQQMKLMNGKSISLVWMSAGWRLLRRTIEIAQITIRFFQCHMLSK